MGAALESFVFSGTVRRMALVTSSYFMLFFGNDLCIVISGGASGSDSVIQIGKFVKRAHSSTLSISASGKTSESRSFSFY